MVVSRESLARVDEHWAVQAVGAAERDRGLLVADARLVRSALQDQVELDFRDLDGDEDTIERLALAYEFAAVEGIEAILSPAATDDATNDLREQCRAGAWRAFELRRLMPVPPESDERIFSTLHLGALAYCGDRWTDLRRWFEENRDALGVPAVEGETWDRRLLYKLFDCWVRLLRKRDWEDLAGVANIVAALRDDQAEFERRYLSPDAQGHGRSAALRLVALYHWAKATELLGAYTIAGEPSGVAEQLDKHFEATASAAAAGQDAPFEIVARWLHVAARRMVAGSVWSAARALGTRSSRFIDGLTRQKSMFELLPPQRAALREHGLLDPAHRAVVVELPTSGGKTLLAEFRILQALNQFRESGGYVAYVAPTRALVTQTTRTLRRDFGPLGIRVEQLTGAVEIDAVEADMLGAGAEESEFEILVATPEKLQLVLRNKSVQRPLALVVLDEAHNIEDEHRGMRIELLLATIRRECGDASFLLMMPYVPNGSELASWLAPDENRTISFGSGSWKPNERVVGLFHATEDNSVQAGWQMIYETLVTTPGTIHLAGSHRAGSPRPLLPPRSSALNAPTLQAAAMASVFSSRGTSIAVATNTNHVWGMARKLADVLPVLEDPAPAIGLVQRYLSTEISEEFELIGMLSRGIAVHHAGLSDETRVLIEWLAAEGWLRVLCATTTIAQGINFPVSSIFLASNKYPYGQVMSHREFWNLAGRAGRFGQDSVGVVGLAESGRRAELTQFVSDAVGDLVSRLVQQLNELDAMEGLDDLTTVIDEPQWRDFRCYVAHLWAEKQDIDSVLADTEQLLRHTYGYTALRAQQTEASRRKADALLGAARQYVQRWTENPENATLADATGFAPEGVRTALLELGNLEKRLAPEDWQPGSLFGDVRQSSLPALVGVMMKIPELSRSLEEITQSGLDRRHIAGITVDWVNGVSIEEIARKYFTGDDDDLTAAITKTCKAVYRTLVNSGPWGISALTKLPTSGLDFEQMSDDQARLLNSLPAMLYHGVTSEAAVLMRMNSVPRSIAEGLGGRFAQQSTEAPSTVTEARRFLRSLSTAEWSEAVPAGSRMSGDDYQAVWRQLAGES